MSNKPKPATDGEKVEMALLRRCRDAHPPTLEEFRSLSEFCGERAAARAHDRAIARAVKKERARCGLVVLAYIGGRITMDDMLAKVRSGNKP
mgnify:FL=1